MLDRDRGVFASRAITRGPDQQSERPVAVAPVVQEEVGVRWLRHEGLPLVALAVHAVQGLRIRKGPRTPVISVRCPPDEPPTPPILTGSIPTALHSGTRNAPPPRIL